MGKGFSAEPFDPIRHQIEDLRQQLLPSRPLCERILTCCPLLPAACGLIAGLVIQRHFAPSFFFWTPVLFVLVAAFVWAQRRCPYPRKLLVFLWLSALAGLLLGAVRLRLFQTPARHDLRRFIGPEPTLVTLRGTLLTEPRLEDRSRWVFGKYQWTPRSTSFLLGVEEVLTQNGWHPAGGRVLAVISEPVKALGAGDRIEFYGRLKGLQPPDNPGMFNGKQYLEDRGIYRTVSIPSFQSVVHIEKNRSDVLLRLQRRLRYRAREALNAYGGDGPEYSGLPETLLLGGRSAIDRQTWTAFQKTGLAHFISLSGMHVGILGGIFWWLGRTAGLEKRARALLCLLLIGLYALVVPPRAPTLRAVFLAEFFFLSILVRRQPQPLNTLALSALVLLAIHPTEVFQAGWQLSYASVLGILLLYEPLLRFLSAPVYVFPAISRRLLALPGSAAFQSALKLLAVGLAAWLGGAGILLRHFGMVTPLSPVWTVLVFPLVFLILLVGFLKLLLVPLLPTLAAGCSVWLDGLSDAFSGIVGGLADLDLLTFAVGRTALWIVLVYYGWLLFVRFWPVTGHIRQRTAVLGALILMASPAASQMRRSLSDDLTITCLSVGHGLAVVSELPGGKVLLFDSGSISRKNPGGRIVVPFLQYRGIESVDRVVLSHGDLDHYNGLPEVLTSIQTKAVFVNPGFLQRSESSSGARHMRTVLENYGGTFWTDRFPPLFSAARVHRLWPDEQTAADPSLSDNDKSEVLLIEYAGKSILLCGDIEADAQRKILERYPDLKADVLLLPHHGSRNNVLPEFIRRLHPAAGVISCARSRLRSTVGMEDSAACWYTPLNGAVTLTIKADGTFRAAGFLN